MPGCSSSSSGLGELEPAFAAGEERRRDLVRSCVCTASNVSSKRRSTVSVSSARSFSSSARLASRSLRCVASSSSRALLGVVLLLRERVHLAERLAAALEPLRALGELVAVVALGALVGARVLEPAARLVGLGLDARDLDVDRGHALRRARQRLAQLDLGRAEAAQLVAELARARTAGVDVRAQRRLEARGRSAAARERRVETLGAGEHTRELMRTRATSAGADGGVDACGLGRPRALRRAAAASAAAASCAATSARASSRSPFASAARERAAEPREVALGGGDRFDRGGELAAQRAFALAELRAASRRARPCGSAPASPRARSGASTTSTAWSSASSARSSRAGRREQRLERADVGAADAQPRRGGGERRLGLRRLLVGAGGGALREPRLLGERLRLVGERARGASRARAAPSRRSRRRTRARRAAGRSRSRRA